MDGRERNHTMVKVVSELESILMDGRKRNHTMVEVVSELECILSLPLPLPSGQRG